MTQIAKKLKLGLGDGPVSLIALIVFQVVCTVFFVADVSTDMEALGLDSLTDVHLLPELGATVGLVIGILFETRVLWRLLRRQVSLTHGLNVAAGALAEVMEAYFREWNLTPSEQDVAAFTIKGYSISEIAKLRGSAEGTVKTHLNAIYRKSGVAGRAQLVSLLVEDLLRAPLVGQGSAAAAVARPGSGSSTGAMA